MAKQEWLEEKSKAVEACMNIGKVDAAYKKIKEAFGEKTSTCMNIKSSDGKSVLTNEGKAESWREYIEGLCKGNELKDNVMERVEEVDEDEMGDLILRTEFDRALKDLSRTKASGVDYIPSELLQCLVDPAMTKLLHLVLKVVCYTASMVVLCLLFLY